MKQLFRYIGGGRLTSHHTQIQAHQNKMKLDLDDDRRQPPLPGLGVRAYDQIKKRMRQSTIFCFHDTVPEDTPYLQQKKTVRTPRQLCCTHKLEFLFFCWPKLGELLLAELARVFFLLFSVGQKTSHGETIVGSKKTGLSTISTYRLRTGQKHNMNIISLGWSSTPDFCPHCFEKRMDCKITNDNLYIEDHFWVIKDPYQTSWDYGYGWSYPPPGHFPPPTKAYDQGLLTNGFP